METKLTNRDMYLSRPLKEALKKYEDDFRHLTKEMNGAFVSIGTFHEWLELGWRNPGARS